MVDKDLNLELTAMQSIALTLGELDPSMRVRVLRWLQERYDDDATAGLSDAPAVATVTPLRVVPPRPVPPDEFLTIGPLAELFRTREPEPAAAPSAQPVATLLHEFVTEFQELAREWDGATQALSAAS